MARRAAGGLLMLIGALLMLVGIARSQGSTVDHPFQIFLSPRDQGDGRDNLIFIDLYNGEERRLALTGTQYTVTADGVMFFDRASGRVKVAQPDGGLVDHPFAQLPPGARRIDWQIGADQIAWTITSGIDSALVTETYVSALNGVGQRLVFTDGPRAGIRAYPIAFNINATALYMDYQPDTIGDITPLRQYAGLFIVDLFTGQAESLPGEPGCFCGAGFGAGWFVRLTLAPGGFDVRAFLGERETRIGALSYPDYNQGGGVLINPAGTRAVYVLARLAGLGVEQDASVIVTVDLLNGDQQPASPPLDQLFRPLAWVGDDAILLANRRGDGTWRFELSSGSLTQIASGVVLGTIGYNNAYD
ncbi:MAG: hypothetical protein L6Q98_05800 [Anaerolineae bacterium]|nr:hypothetical protein [Anaerolineae bacterium]NUQ03729.1 hypothetical protein [Anaerolineae bacterium]